ncbi:hypothetical protein PENTCL1PPCAC_21330, partial [Pristionchus entomophagus]
MLRLLLVLIACCSVMARDFECDDAGQECAVVYKDEQCGLDRYSIRIEEIKDLGSIGFDDSIKSVVVTKGCQLYLFD